MKSAVLFLLLVFSASLSAETLKVPQAEGPAIEIELRVGRPEILAPLRKAIAREALSARERAVFWRRRRNFARK